MVWRDQRDGRGSRARPEVLGAGDLVGKDRRDQVLGAHARELRRHLAAAAEARQRQRHAVATQRQRVMNIGASSSAWISSVRTRGRMQVAGDLGELEAVRGGEREDDIVLGRRRLQLEVELAAEALAQRQAPGAVDAAAVGRMDDELHAADLVEEALEHDRVLRRQAAERRVRRGEILDQLLRGGRVDADLVDQPAQGARRRPGGRQARGDLGAQARHRRRQLVAAPGRLAEPERNGRRRAVRVLDPHHAALDAQDAVALVAELEDVAGHALDREVLVQRADDVVLGLEQHLVVGVVGDGAA